MTPTQKAVLKTLAYADIFDYPLTQTELQTWLISSKPLNLTTIPNHPQIRKTQNYYHLKNRQAIVRLRRRRAHFSRPKLQLAQRTTRYFKLIPSIQLIAVTGALSMNNSDKSDDIDLMIITTTNRLWLTRFLSILLLELLGLRRRPHTQNLSNKICLNLLLDESSLTLPPFQRNLYTAHEVIQIKPLLDRGNTYQKFLNANSWVKQYLPHAIKPTNLKLKLPTNPACFLETLAFKLQHLYMKPKITREKISFHSAFFHPRPTNQLVMQQYHQKLKDLNLK